MTNGRALALHASNSAPYVRCSARTCTEQEFFWGIPLKDAAMRADGKLFVTARNANLWAG